MLTDKIYYPFDTESYRELKKEMLFLFEKYGPDRKVLPKLYKIYKKCLETHFDFAMFLTVC